MGVIKRAYMILAEGAQIETIGWPHVVVKLGESVEPHNRAKSMSTGNASKLRVVWAQPYPTQQHRWEPILHHVYEMFRLEGEWFALPPREYDEVMALSSDAQIVKLNDRWRHPAFEVIDYLKLGASWLRESGHFLRDEWSDKHLDALWLMSQQEYGRTVAWPEEAQWYSDHGYRDVVIDDGHN